MSAAESDLTTAQRVLRGDRCRCRACGEYVNSTSAFDRHRVGAYDLTAPKHGRRCLTPDEMRARRME